MRYTVIKEVQESNQWRPLLSRSRGDLSRRGERDLSRRGGERERRRGGDLERDRRVYGGETERGLGIRTQKIHTLILSQISGHNRLVSIC